LRLINGWLAAYARDHDRGPVMQSSLAALILGAIAAPA
jgi:hypothetical protein